MVADNLLISIIVPAYNAGNTIKPCLKGCLSQNYPRTEVIVVDDGSTDDTTAIVHSHPVALVQQENQGPAAARNHGARQAQGDVLAFTDSDCVPGPTWIATLVEGFTDGVAAVGGGYALAQSPTLLARMIHYEIALRHERHDGEVDFLGSFNVAYVRNAFEQAGGFDETFREASAEDNDLAYRLSDAGGKLVFISNAEVTHCHPDRLGPYLRTQRRHGYWRMKLYAKHIHRAPKGDQYAGISDLSAPPVAVLAVASIAALTLTWIVPASTIPLLVLAAAAWFLLLALHVAMPIRMWRHTKDLRMLAFIPISMLRSAARGLGMLHGFAVFFILRKRHS